MSEYLYALATDRKNGPGDAVVKTILWVLSLAFHLGLALRIWLYRAGFLRSFDLKRPVICIGNITWGGVGKTPLVEAVVQRLVERGFKPAVLTRGYMADGGSASDEAKMMELSLPGVPILVGADRYQRAKDYLKNHRVDVFVMDDGYQHLRLKRTTDVVLLDAVNPWGNGHLLPRGILREPFSHLRRADRIVLFRADHPGSQAALIQSRLARWGIKAPVFFARLEVVDGWDVLKRVAVPPGGLAGTPVIAVSGIGNPERFSASLEEMGCDVRRHFGFEDHYSYRGSDIRDIIEGCRRENISLVLTTMKDAVKLEKYQGQWPGSLSVVALRVRVSFVREEERFFDGIFSALGG
jgi:tetraacyldisaccharide 4'-kinase